MMPPLPALQNNTIDATGLASLDELTIARSTAGIVIRRAPTQLVPLHLQRGARGDPGRQGAAAGGLRKGIDRQAIAKVTQRGLVDDPVPLNNHIFVAGQKGYQDNSAVVAYDPEKAKAELDELGWKLNGQFREKDGRQLVIRDLFYDASSTRQFAPGRPAQSGPDRGQAAAGRQGRWRFLHRVRQHRRLRHRPVLLGR